MPLTPEPSAGGPATPAGPAPIAPLLAAADPKVGDQFAHRVCVACHTFDKGGKNGVGPNLYGVVAGPHDHEGSFNYSPALEKFKGQPWTFGAVERVAVQPSAYAPGTRMSYTGITNDKQRADVIACLRTLSDNPVPLPKPEEAAAPAAAPAAAAAPVQRPGARRQPLRQRLRQARRPSSSRGARLPGDAELDQFIAAAEAAADVAGAVVQPFFRAGFAIDTKSDRSPVTIADRSAEQAMRAVLAERFPDHGVLGEELGWTGPRRGCAGCSIRSTGRGPSSADVRRLAR